MQALRLGLRCLVAEGAASGDHGVCGVCAHVCGYVCVYEKVTIAFEAAERGTASAARQRQREDKGGPFLSFPSPSASVCSSRLVTPQSAGIVCALVSRSSRSHITIGGGKQSYERTFRSDRFFLLFFSLSFPPLSLYGVKSERGGKSFK